MRKTVFSCRTKETVVVDMSPEEEARMLQFHAEVAAQPKPLTLEERVALLENRNARTS